MGEIKKTTKSHIHIGYGFFAFRFSYGINTVEINLTLKDNFKENIRTQQHTTDQIIYEKQTSV
jgi:hypothetical protein